MASPGKDFEQKVADAYSALGYQVVHNTQLPGKQTDIVAKRFVPGGPPITLAVECKDEAGPVDNTEMFAFISRIVAHRESGRATFGVLVSAGGFTHPARAAAEEHPFIALLTWEELNADIVDVRHPLRKLVDEYEASEIGQHYLPLGSERLSWADLAPAPSTSLDEALERWKATADSDPGAPGALFVLGDFGAGKSTLLHHLRYDRAKAYVAQEDQRIPLLVPLLKFPEIQDVGALLRVSFRDAYYREITAPLLWQYLREGRFYLLLDGFDEMVERSDEDRRLELFYRLLPLLQTRSPAIVTSRGSFFVERGELEGLLARLDAQRLPVGEGSPPPTEGGGLAAGMLRRKLIAHYREPQGGPAARGSVPPYSTAVFKLLPLDEKRIETFVDRYRGKLAEVGSSPEEVMRFIDETYDLWDLASRPLLLDMIVRSVLFKDLDPSRTDVQYGAAGLYEIYTASALQVDLWKGKTRQEGLSAGVRRMLAEALAIHMHEEDRLTVEFSQVLAKILPDNEQLARALEKTDFSTEEIETDFATCSFVTLERKGGCRFIHRSFRGFFVARILKAHLDRGHPLLEEQLDNETLYFLGSFAPTDPAVGQALWSGFLRASDPIRRRNMLIAYLHTQPVHSSKQISQAEATKGAFGRLGFRRSRMNEVTWRDCSFRKLQLDRVKWEGIAFESSKITHLEATGSTLEMEMAEVSVQDLELEGMESARLRCEATDVASLSLTDTALHLDGEGVRLDRLEANRSALTSEEGVDVELGDALVDQSRVRLKGGWGVKRLEARRSVLSMNLEGIEQGVLDLRASVMRVAAKPPPVSLRSRHFPQKETAVDEGSVLICVGPVAGSLLDIGPCGLFGNADPGLDLGPLPKAWGVLDVGRSFPRSMQDAVDPEADGVRHGELLLVKSEWFEREAFPGGRLASVDRLQRFAVKAGTEESFDSWDLLPELLAAVRSDFEAVAAAEWPAFAVRQGS